MGKRGDPSSYGPGRDPHRPPSLGASGGGVPAPVEEQGGYEGLTLQRIVHGIASSWQRIFVDGRRGPQGVWMGEGHADALIEWRVGGGIRSGLCQNALVASFQSKSPTDACGGASSGGLLPAEGTRGRVASAFRWCTTKELWAVTVCASCPYQRHPHAHTHPYLILFLVSPPTAAPPHLSSSAFPSHQRHEVVLLYRGRRHRRCRGGGRGCLCRHSSPEP